MTYKGVVKGKVIELEQELNLPEGSIVEVEVQPVSEEPTRKAKESAIAEAKAFGERLLKKRGLSVLAGSSAEFIREARGQRSEQL